MPPPSLTAAHLWDLSAAALFFTAWLLYGRAADNDKTPGGASLLTTMHRLRIKWLTEMQGRTLRMPDILILNIATSNYTFFASTSILIIAGAFTLLIGGNQWRDIITDMPMVSAASATLTPLKLLALTLIFVYSFFKFTWSIRQVGYCAIVLGGIPNRYPAEGEQPFTPEERIKAEKRAEILAPIFTLAGNNFNHGLRAYYFGLAMLPWFIGPIWMVGGGVLMVIILWQREFHSKTLHRLARAEKAFTE